MALYNNMTAADFKAQATSIATEVERMIGRAKEFSERMAGIGEADSGLDTDYYANLMSMRTDLASLVAWYDANTSFIDRFCPLLTR